MLNNKRKVINLSAANPVKSWLTLLSGLTGFTEREIDVLELLIKKRNELSHKGIEQPHLSSILFSTISRREYCQLLGISEYNFTNLLGSIRKKKGIHMVDEVEDIHNEILPASEILIKFI